MKRESQNKTQLFLKVYETKKTDVYNYALRMLHDKDTAADITQSVFEKLLLNFENLRDKKKINAWLFVTARNEIYGVFRRTRNIEGDVPEEDLAEDSGIVKNIELDEFKKILFDELEKLPLLNKEIYLMKEYGKLSYKEIADVTGEDMNNVKARLFRTRKKLIEKISKIFFEEPKWRK
jgi:RNA polymerase sigma-70 factor (ECF subfamily)